MKTTRLSPTRHPPGTQRMGLTHLAISLGSEKAVDELTARLRSEGIAVLDGPRRTGERVSRSLREQAHRLSRYERGDAPVLRAKNREKYAGSTNPQVSATSVTLIFV